MPFEGVLFVCLFSQFDKAPSLTVILLRRGLYANPRKPMSFLEGRVEWFKKTYPVRLSGHAPALAAPLSWELPYDPEVSLACSILYLSVSAMLALVGSFI